MNDKKVNIKFVSKILQSLLFCQKASAVRTQFNGVQYGFVIKIATSNKWCNLDLYIAKERLIMCEL